MARQGNEPPLSDIKTKTFALAANVFTACDVKTQTFYRRHIFMITVHDDAQGVNVIQIHSAIPLGEVGAPIIMPALPNIDTINTLANVGLYTRTSQWHSPFYVMDDGRQLWCQATANCRVSITYFDKKD